MSTVTTQKACENCKTIFHKSGQLSWRQWATRRFCSHKCAGQAESTAKTAVRLSLRESFEMRFKKTEGCWIWSGTIEGYGYGVIDHNRRRYRAHVLALKFDGRPVPDGMIACHHCDNPPCVNPAHLYVGTPAENARDAKERGLLPRGESHHNAKLTEAEIRQIRSLKMPATHIALIFGVSRHTISRIQSGRGWEHVA